MPRLQPTSAKLACTVTESPVGLFLPSWQEVAVWLVRDYGLQRIQEALSSLSPSPAPPLLLGILFPMKILQY